MFICAHPNIVNSLKKSCLIAEWNFFFILFFIFRLKKIKLFVRKVEIAVKIWKWFQYANQAEWNIRNN